MLGFECNGWRGRYLGISWLEWACSCGVDVCLGLGQAIGVDWREQYGDADRNCEERRKVGDAERSGG